jgi:hypothetical protein
LLYGLLAGHAPSRNEVGLVLLILLLEVKSVFVEGFYGGFLGHWETFVLVMVLICVENVV